MEAALAPEAGQKFATDGYFIATGSLIADDVLAAARVGMDAVRDGQFDTGVPPRTMSPTTRHSCARSTMPTSPVAASTIF